MSEEKKEYFIKEYIKEIETEDSIRHSMFYSEFEDEAWDTIYPEYIGIGYQTKSWARESSSLEISKLEDMIDELKEKGCNYVEIIFHCDHDSYILNGLNMRKAKKNEIITHINSISNDNKKQLESKKLELMRQLEIINQQIDSKI